MSYRCWGFGIRDILFSTKQIKEKNLKKILMTLAAMSVVSVQSSADMYKHNLQVFTSNTMEIPCSGTPKELYFGTYEQVAKLSGKEVKDIINGGISEVGSNVGSWFSANGVSGSDLAKNAGVGIIGTMVGLAIKNAVYSSMDDPEYVLISECNSGKRYTRLITMVVSNDKLDLATAKQLAKQDQNKMKKKVNR